MNRSDPLDCGALSALPATRTDFVRAVGECGRKLGTRGTYLMTVYAQRHPERVRSLVLSSAYPLAVDMWGRPNARAARRSLRLVCQRSAGACDGDEVLHDIARLAQRLRTRPIPYTLDGQQGPRHVLPDQHPTRPRVLCVRKRRRLTWRLWIRRRPERQPRQPLSWAECW